MSRESPMMRRMKPQGLGSKLPKKGRIRIILIILAVTVIGVKICGALLKTESSAKVAKPKIEDVVVQKSAPSYLLSFDDISSIVQQQHPKFDSSSSVYEKSGKKFRIHYSLDLSLQKLGMSLMKAYHPKYGAVVAVQPSTGRVLSLISYENDSCPKLADDLYSRSFFPAASVFKTITASAAIEKDNYTSQSIVKHVGKKSTLYKYQLEKELKSFTELPLEEAFANSINPVFARLGMYVVGEQTIEDYAGRYGFNSTVPFELSNDASKLIPTDSTFNLAELASGFNQHTTLSPLLGALIASSISENGRMPRPYIVDSVTTDNDVIAYKAEKQLWKTPIREGTARELRTMMHSVAMYGTARKSFKLIKQSAQFDSLEYGGKTGSVDKDSAGRVDWFIGFARNPTNPQERIAVGAVTVHGAFWTVHSSYIAAEYFRSYMHSFLKSEQEKKIKTVVKKDTGESSQSNQKS